MTLKEQLENIEDIELCMPSVVVEKDYIEMYVEADENDADYIDQTFKIDLETFLNILPIARLILNKYKESRTNYSIQNWEDKESYLTEEQIELFNEYVPWNEYGVHTISSINFRLLQETGETFIIKI